MMDAQKEILHATFIDWEITRFRHGGADGSDTIAHWIAYHILNVKTIEIFPADRKSTNKKYWEGIGLVKPRKDIKIVMAPIMAPLLRNAVIVDGCDLLVAIPAGDREEWRSGTWATVRYARKIKREHIIIWPNGEKFISMEDEYVEEEIDQG